MLAALLLIWGTSAHAEDECRHQPEPDRPLRAIQVNEIATLVSEHKGCVVMLELYASWCGTCTRLAPEVTELVRRLQPEGLIPVGASVDSSKGALVNWRKTHAREYDPVIVEDWTLQLLRDAFTAMSVSFQDALPLFVLFDREGNAVLHVSEPSDLSTLETQARTLL